MKPSGAGATERKADREAAFFAAQRAAATAEQERQRELDAANIALMDEDERAAFVAERERAAEHEVRSYPALIMTRSR